MSHHAPIPSPDGWARQKDLFDNALEAGSAWRECLLKACDESSADFREVEALLLEHFAIELQLAQSSEALAKIKPKYSAPILIENRFEIHGSLGHGTFGQVYKAFDRTRGKDVALKILRDPTPDAIFRFKQQWRRINPIRHPNIVSMYDWIEGESQWMGTMEFIEGTDFLTFVRHAERDGVQNTNGDQRRYSDIRLRSALRQLAEGLNVLHARNWLHRDLKPSNVLISRSGRVVLLDFDLVRDLAPTGPRTVSFGGTAEYMSPEQAKGSHVLKSPSDWYAVGVMLYQALTSELPFSGEFWTVLKAKNDQDPKAPAEKAPGVDKDLNRLCLGLLAREPEQRFGYEAVVEVLEPVRHSSHEATPASIPTTPIFVGRAAQLAVLENAYREATRHTPRTIHISGPSGIGKSVLIREFLERVRRTDPKSVILFGKCYESESVFFKGLDDLVDRLAIYLMELPFEERNRLLPDDFSLLVRMFPVLGQIQPDDMLSSARRLSAEVRVRAFAALTELLHQIARENRVILVIDDLQWGDLDGSAFLLDLMRVMKSMNDAALLLVLAYRSEDIESVPALRLIKLSREAGDDRVSARNLQDDEGTVQISLRGLLIEEGVQLARSLFPSHMTIDEKLIEVVKAADGDPFLIHQIAWWVARPEVDWASLFNNLNIEDILKVRIDSLADAERRLLEMAAVAGQPTTSSIFEHGFRTAEMFGARDSLLNARLLRSRRVQEVDQIDVYHDRVRTAVLHNLSETSLRQRHLEIANALAAQSDTDAERLWFHYKSAGDLNRSSRYARASADLAMATLAFNKAAMLYKNSLDEGSWTPVELRSLWTKLAQALSNAGLGGEAADAFLRAADGASGREHLQLTTDAALQLLRSGRKERGVRLLENLLRRAGFLPVRNLTAVLVGIFLLRLRIELRFQKRKWTVPGRLHFKSSRPGERVEKELFRLDVCGAAAIGLGMIDPFRAALFSSHYTFLALKANDVYRLSLALALEAAQLCHTSGSTKIQQSNALLQQAATLAEESDNPHARGFVRLMSSTVHYLQGDWANATKDADLAAEIFISECPGAAWEQTTANIFSFLGRTARGLWKENQRRLTFLLKEAHARGDLYGTHNFRILSNAYVLDLAQDNPSEARRHLDDDLAAWFSEAESKTHKLPEGYSVQQAAALSSKADIALYRGTPWEVWEEIEQEWPLLMRSQLLRLRTVYVFTRFARARVALAMAQSLPADSVEQRRYLGIAAEDAAALERKGPLWSHGLASLLRSGLATFSGDKAIVTESLKRTIELLDDADLIPPLMVALHRRAALQNGQLDQRAADWFKREEVENPVRVISALAPGLWSQF